MELSTQRAWFATPAKRRGIRSCVSSLAALLCALSTSACLGPNPLLGLDDDDTTETSPETDESGSTDTDTTSESSETEDDDSETGSTCDNDILDGDESDLDCGGSCEPCDPGLACLTDSDCASQICVDDLCQAPTCEDDIKNGDEFGIDCGGPCVLCKRTPVLTKLDDSNGTDATTPRVAAFDDGGFAVSYHGPESAHIRWFDALGQATSPSLTIVDDPIYSLARIPIEASDEHLHTIESLIFGPVGGGADKLVSFQLQAGESTQVTKVDTWGEVARVSDLRTVGSRVFVTWVQGKTAYLRRWDYALAGGAWVDIDPQPLDVVPQEFSDIYPSLSEGPDGIVGVAWTRCQFNGSPPCDLVVRRFDNSWIDPSPTVITLDGNYTIEAQLAIAADGRAMVAWLELDIEAMHPHARMLDADFDPDGEEWAPQITIHPPKEQLIDVAALSDGNFALAWVDRENGKVRLRRYTGPDTPLLPEFEDEAPWPSVVEPTSVHLDNVGNSLYVTWSSDVDGVAQIQGQVLSY